MRRMRILSTMVREVAFIILPSPLDMFLAHNGTQEESVTARQLQPDTADGCHFSWRCCSSAAVRRCASASTPLWVK